MWRQDLGYPACLRAARERLAKVGVGRQVAVVDGDDSSEVLPGVVGGYQEQATRVTWISWKLLTTTPTPHTHLFQESLRPWDLFPICWCRGRRGAASVSFAHYFVDFSGAVGILRVSKSFCNFL
jgi:hypothetical protein